MNKVGKPIVAEMGGICVIFAFVLTMLVYIGIETFYVGEMNFTGLFACLCTIFIATIIGMIDDILGWKIGLTKLQKTSLTIIAVIPMVVINAGSSIITLPVFGPIELGILYPLLVIPIGIVGASNGFNMLAGYNGLEAGMGVIILSTLAYIAYVSGNITVSILALGMVAALFGFLWFNWTPAKIFPGDTLTYPVGALIACVAILGNMQRFALILFIPYIIDFILPMRKMLRVEAFAKVNDDGSLEQPYEKLYDSTHVAIAILKKIKTKVYERDVTMFLCGVEGILAIMVIAYYYV
jgi:UDP-N-acetylglucosamine--dolichyl-phosphate N-acetylglucosaminephosphotransferase